MPQSNTAVEITRGEDHVDIWVDANNNGVRDDDDVNIYVTKSGSFYAESPLIKGHLDQVLRDKVRDAAVSLLSNPSFDQSAEDRLSTLALQLVVKALTPDENAAAGN